MIPGIDVSHYQGTIDWQKVKAAGIRFVYLKATQGASFIDPMLFANYIGAKAAGIPIGLYHVFVANNGHAQVSNWRKAQGLYVPQLPAWLDIEPGALTEETVWQASDMLANAFVPGHDVVYCSPSTADAVLTDEAFAQYGLAVAHYCVPEPRIPKPWTTFQFWQHSASGTVDGISASVDLDWFNGTEDEFQMLISPKAT